ncbi:C2H2 transcription factor Swi5 [Hirsutella rhossiliensis]|uniref:pH-response transcription factor pacC/RIM101 n=1 Tax=Hirsutella rhossiliensis TaxID=111463 RepID=A0A9P8MSQ1_9HYPO|nr:C2H2 transcription factor Swi5 [Hirsutella rhossiliensis]KAH0959744.1 C2H2 transcription factor Swi5 [Hirsutella rhossiliensis]
MLSNPTTGLHARQRQHRRQSSTPSAFEGVKIPTLPNANQQRQAAGHRRGLSLDTRRQQQMASPTTRQDYKHHVLREAQQQRLQARPGTHHHHHQQQQRRPPQPQQQQHQAPPPPPQYASMALGDRESYLMSPHATPQTNRFNPAPCFDTSSIPFNPYGAQLNLMMQKNQESFANNMGEAKEFELYTNESDLTTPTFVNFPESPSGQNWTPEDASRRNSRRISNGIVDRVHKYENMGMEGMQRPMTPPNQNGNNYYPPTPMETPHDRTTKREQRPDRFHDDYDESMEETIKPMRNRSNQRAPNMFQEMRQQAERSPAQPSPPRSNRMPNAKRFVGVQAQAPEFVDMNALRSQFAKLEGRYDDLGFEGDALHQAADLHHPSPADAQHMGQFLGGFDDNPEMPRFPPPGLGEAGSSAPSRRASPHRRNDIASINIEETKTETGVTIEEIAQYIRSPETTDGKWTCLFDDCGKKFGRKENIKSHVQTHLNDRQYQCPTCKKCFVRQHDLKRHAKIHTGVKPYPCECGNSFARHDALTRHRQRGMCIGAFDGIVRKVVKRGRPRKNRPDMEERTAKSARQRRKNMSISSTSSMSGYSDSSAVNSPDNDYNMLDDVVDLGVGKTASYSSAPMPNMMPIPPPTAVEAAPSPTASVHSFVSPDDMMEKTLSNPATPAKSVASHYTTPPELSQSSSPPAAPFFDASFGGPGGCDDMAAAMASASGMVDPANMGAAMPPGIGDPDEDLLLQFTNDDGLAQLDRDSHMLMMTKFDEEFDNVGMFNSDDMFFGSS